LFFTDLYVRTKRCGEQRRGKNRRNWRISGNRNVFSFKTKRLPLLKRER
jgi:hypothetical protein